eukprot:TRINITY_DN4830_c0_g2_i1.p5 TRINITY_DN4830_c0_g2~~TRINITY_DN4830_c0_g2_i1.p5  ORF type:complete len:103 (-),score=0.20 TRINITY_DN4830_c0_g2_i1:242-550(-)
MHILYMLIKYAPKKDAKTKTWIEQRNNIGRFYKVSTSLSNIYYIFIATIKLKLDLKQRHQYCLEIPTDIATFFTQIVLVNQENTRVYFCLNSTMVFFCVVIQ